ncbi:aldehyde dehydrogenase family protein [Mesorhizobium sp. SB112]|uniref:aldehyde dehydrogenase family protein n=1 Tax=Mesorhizobium sp. SB112 TaxID=3151853 RepID=UPI003264ECED
MNVSARDTAIVDHGCLIDGTWRPAESGEWIEMSDPADGTTLARIARGGAAEINAAVAAARRAQPAFTMRPPVERVRILNAIARRITADAERLAQIESRDTGKPITQARNDAVAAARFFEFYAGLADKVLGTSIPMGSDFVDFTVREPLGVTAQIVPWNYPLQIACRGIAPALAAGNAIVVKPAELACLSVLEIARICEAEGLPKGVLNVVPGYGAEAGAALASHPDIDLVVFTGSVATGSQVMQAAAKNIVPVLLELGGKSPNILLADTELDAAIPIILTAAFPHSGQTCSAGTRLLVERPILGEVMDRLAARLPKLTLGRGLDDPDLGPLVSAEQRRKVEDYISLGMKEGADVLSGGSFIGDCDHGVGHFVRPTVLSLDTADARVAREEIFGPVLTVLPFDTLDEAETIANATEYGLVAGVWGRDIGRLHRLAQRVRSGQVFINCYGAGGGVEIPFGGTRKSGFGREKGVEAIASYTQVKNVCLRVDLPAEG